MRFFFPDEWMSFYDYLLPSQKPTFNFLINTGARINEIRHILVGDVDFDRQSIIIKYTKSRNPDKTRKMRVISISQQFAKSLKKIIRDLKLKAEDKFPLMSTPGGNIAMKKTLKEIGIKDWKDFSIHNIRKTTEVWLLSLNIDSLKVAKHMGHTIAIAEKFYVSPDTFNYEDKKMMRDIIGDLYSQREYR